MLKEINSETLILSITDILTMQDCPRQLYFKKIERLKSEITAAALPFGTVLHAVIDIVVFNQYMGIEFDIDDVFNDQWAKEFSNKIVSYPKDFDEDSMKKMGLALARRFTGLWPELGFLPLTDEQEKPVLGKLLEADLGENVIVRAKLDFQGFSPDVEFCIIDYKMARSEHSEEFCSGSDQLTGYQYIADANMELLGAPRVDKIGFMDGIKRKVPEGKARGKGPVLNRPVLINRRSNRQLSEFRDSVLWKAEDIRRKRFPRASRQAHNSPCDMCDFSGLCFHGDMKGLSQREPFRKKVA